MGKSDLIKFRHDNCKGIFHYTVFEGAFVALSELDTGKVSYIKKHGTLDITFDQKSETYDIMNIDIVEDKEYVQKVYDYMTALSNSYFNDGIEGLCVLKFHK
ncbi:hypothetical protein KQ51_00473 [Candidatus Izimaplasma bacterium HR1]|jgi:general stress protein 26|uniref:hypothetical protein n=1 Tax=Candidatus Izimoplasma sp. HR1 TaxID=1541959 RepID=UPI0004F6BE45|nr:hypothetical protein KQ51_00473 [Candidatus Izimaplasma bacterium HR1]